MPGDIIILHKCTKNHDHVPEIWCATDVWQLIQLICQMWLCQLLCVNFILVYFLPFCLPNNPKNQNLKEMKKTLRDIIILHMRTKNYDQMMYGSWAMVRDRRTNKQTDGRTDERTDTQKKWHIELNSPPKNKQKSKWVFIHEITRLIIMKIKMKMKNQGLF